MLIVGIEGGPGSGKTTVADITIPGGGDNHYGSELSIPIIEKYLIKNRS